MRTQLDDTFKLTIEAVLHQQVGKRSKIIDIENALKLANADGVVTYDEIRQNLKKWDLLWFES